MKNYIQELGVVPSIAEPVVIFCDNNGAIAQAKEPRYHHRSKHILRRDHLLREMVSRGDCMMDRISSAENTADPLTKPMLQVAHTQHLDKMDLRCQLDCTDSRGLSYGSLGGLIMESEFVARTDKLWPQSLPEWDRRFLCRAIRHNTISSNKHRYLVQDGNRRSIPCPRPRPGDGRRKDRTYTDPKPKCSRNNSPSLYVPWTVARRPPIVTSSLDQGKGFLVASSPGHWLLAHRSRARQVAGCWLAGREPARSLAASSQVASSPGLWLLARRSRAREIAGCWLAGRQVTGDPCELGAADHCLRKESFTSNDHFW
ncbi:UNVERIFIED_CONTAM: Retrovirus-related Pol polyprotein from transposon RE2 [Sesamum radiatum]|uniref:Retrovirus-related Pol polyprotein from transposon RE2 n=1 Tax=Sesamum radiatum TaxID=300843 RepID=A0AAW2VML1_SESRA